ncbi:beta-galactosidase [Streptomyces sp. NPDC005393]|uniref:glycoside hydrolase family 35 protein n=1 Tax=Streptomyces sp. NPDC005393 TaxID=3157041 RepID=UPI0033A4C863
MPALTVTDDGFLLHGKPFRIISGALHYFRTHPDQWADRLRKARLLGLNTVETYLPWNLHQPAPGALDLDGLLDLPRFLELAQAEGLRVVLRPGPYICAEWEGGGLPSWLTADPNIRLRSADPRFTGAVDAYFDLLLPPLAPFMAASGGPVIAVQVENEYGAYGDDTAYLAHLADALHKRGVGELLFTCDQADKEKLAAGSLPGVLATGTFGSRVEDSLQVLRAHQESGPLMCTEFWIGWFDHWGEPHHVRAPEDAAAALDALLSAGTSVNLYMFHGGTNFGFTNGANHDHTYTPGVTSYDYDAVLTECGDPSPKYAAFRDVIARHATVPDEPVPEPSPKLPPTEVALTASANFLVCAEFLSPAEHFTDPPTMERLGQAFGFVLYGTELPALGDHVLHFTGGVGDRAQVFVNGAPAGVVERERNEDSLHVRIPEYGARLDVLVENLGRANYGAHIGDAKGITGPVTLDGRPLEDWTCHGVPLNDLPTLPFRTTDTPVAGPSFHRGTFTVDTPADAYLALPGWTKGLAWINGFNLGRYWSRGPQRRLYVPAPVLRAGANELTLLELHAATSRVAWLMDEPDLGWTVRD